MSKQSETKAEVQAAGVEKFDRQQIVKSSRFSNRQDVLNVLLEDDKQYTLEEVDRILDTFLNGKVN